MLGKGFLSIAGQEAPSKVKRSKPVPATLATVTVATAVGVWAAGDVRHVTVVLEAHDDIAHSACTTETIGEVSNKANWSPLSVAVSPPLTGMLTLLSST